MSLTAKQEMFCREYLIDLNATQAAIRAGYSPKTAPVIGCENLIKPNVQERIAELKGARETDLEVSAGYVLKRLTEIDQLDIVDILTDSGDLLPVREWPKPWRTSLCGLELVAYGGDDTAGMLKKIKWPDKVKNLELLGKHVEVMAFKEQQSMQLSGVDGAPIEVATLSKSEYLEARNMMLADDDC